MALFEIAGNSTETVKEIILALGNIGLWLQAIGILVVLIIISTIIDFVLNRKKLKKLNIIERKINSIENKIDRILKKRK
jgi:hypothetical protein